jgi:hypothetical protein
MPLILVVRSLNPWLNRFGVQPGDYIVDRAIGRGDPLPTDEVRYLLCRSLPASGESTGWVLGGIADGDLEAVEGVMPSSDLPSSASHPWLQLLSSPPERPAQTRRRWRRQA